MNLARTYTNNIATLNLILESFFKRLAKLGYNFFVGNSFPTCNINFSAAEILGQTEANK